MTHDAVDSRYLRKLAEGLSVSSVLEPVTTDVDLDGGRFHVVNWGPGTAAPVVLLHGGNQNAHTWDGLCLLLADEYRLVAPDLRGHGDSAWAEDGDYTLDAFAEDTRGLIESMGLRSLVLVGMSWGGLVALQVAGALGECLSALVLVDVGPDIQRDEGQRIVRRGQQSWQPRRFKDFLGDSLRRHPGLDPELAELTLKTALRRLPDGRWTWKWDPARLAAYDPDLQARRQAELWDAVLRVAQPVLVIRGAESRVFSRQNASELAARFQDGRLTEIPDAGHNVQLDNPLALAAELRIFLDRVTGRTI